jgi:exonuclease VII small subunit
MTYDEAISRAEALVTKLEQADAISMDEYKRIATEATALLKQCKEEITRR